MRNEERCSIFLRTSILPSPPASERHYQCFKLRRCCPSAALRCASQPQPQLTHCATSFSLSLSNRPPCCFSAGPFLLALFFPPVPFCVLISLPFLSHPSTLLIVGRVAASACSFRGCPGVLSLFILSGRFLALFGPNYPCRAGLALTALRHRARLDSTRLAAQGTDTDCCAALRCTASWLLCCAVLLRRPSPADSCGPYHCAHSHSAASRPPHCRFRPLHRHSPLASLVPHHGRSRC